ncbi:hypothetical protein PPTG_19998 [Phytophthora nicotianae INRA-310]|uniref:Uncharacterized protein n=1 Tax=Phytophthora nicotianae (strain INRA-310) TaxID=761204 RepID=W2PAF7_PHYN3|nr:hypothetical protein PPTG_19998 [Phytophthora nicotianae INRA-310]ETM97781.1 hypothetical protein PPTG_19998 [Phytophthora nicotianae INRA-310]
MTSTRNSIEFLLVSPNPDVVRVLSRGCHRVYLPELGRSREVAPVSAQMGSNYARMETEGQPEGGWNVDVTAMSCGYEAAARYLRNWALIQRDDTSSPSDPIKRLLDAVPQSRITKARLIEAATKGDDAGEQEWVLPSGVDLRGLPTYQMRTILDDQRVNGRVVS